MYAEMASISSHESALDSCDQLLLLFNNELYRFWILNVINFQRVT